MFSVLLVAAVGQSCIQQTQPGYVAPVQYQQNYNQAYVEKTIFVAVEDPATYYAGLVGTQQRLAERQQQTQQVQSTTDQKIDQLTRLVTDLQRRLETQQYEPPIPSKPTSAPSIDQLPRPVVPSPTTPVSEAAPPPPTVAQAASSVVAAESRDSPGLAILAAKCQSCHTGAATKGGGHQLFTADGNFAVRDRDLLDRIESAIATGSMPKGKQQQLTLREYVSIRDFLAKQASGLAIDTSNQRKKIR